MAALINEQGLEIIKRYEGLRLEVYLCPAGIPSVGFGSTYGLDHRRLDMGHRPITELEAEGLLIWHIENIEPVIARLVRVPVTSNQWSAIVSLIVNIGTGNFQSSALRMKLNRRDYDGAADEFPKWRRGGGRILPGLVRRRAAERELFLEP